MNSVNLKLNSDEILILFDLLSSRIDSQDSDDGIDLSDLDTAQKSALTSLLAALEPVTDDVFNDDYIVKVEMAKKSLLAGLNQK